MYSEVTSVAGGMFVRSESQAENSSVNQSQWEQKYKKPKVNIWAWRTAVGNWEITTVSNVDNYS